MSNQGPWFHLTQQEAIGNLQISSCKNVHDLIHNV